jgi:hypothetical protein
MLVNIQEDIQLEFDEQFLMVNYEDLNELLDLNDDMIHFHVSIKINLIYL